VIQTLKLRNFRNFSSKDFFFERGLNCIYGNNGLWKSNIVDAISLLSLGELFWLEYDALVKEGELGFYVDIQTYDGEKLSLSYDKETKKKKLSLLWKPTTKTKFLQSTFPCVIFHPLTLNMMYLSPSLRREYMDEILSQAFDEYASVLKRYKEAVRNRNKFLIAIQEGKGKREDIKFWENIFIDLAVQIYEWRDEYINFISSNIQSYIFLLWGKIQSLEFLYKTKVTSSSKRFFIQEYLEKNRERDILLGATHIGPHVDDFDIMIDKKSITSFASRGETKTMILWLKILEARFLEQKKQKKPIIVIDDFLSELDDIHKKYVFQTFADYQTIITSITPLSLDGENCIIQL
jgi:DNA replication and repair protein RecF